MADQYETVLVERDGAVATITINRPERRNAVDRVTANRLFQTFADFDADASLAVAILTGAGGYFCAGADLKALVSGDANRLTPPSEDNAAHDEAPMGPTRMSLSKPVIAAIEGPAVAGGLELALWCDLRVAAETAVFGVYCRRFGVPLIDGGTVRLPRLIGASRAMDMILTGRGVSAQEAFDWGLANRIAPPGAALAHAEALARALAALPQDCMRRDRLSALGQWSLSEREALAAEFALGQKTLASGETMEGAKAFAGGAGRGGAKRDEL